MELILEEPKICELLLGVGVETLKNFLEKQILWLSGQMNLAHNLQPWQVDFISSHLLENYPTESLADFVLVFKRMATGFYGPDYHKLDAASIGACIQKHIEEKAYLLEQGHAKRMKEEEDTIVDYEAFKIRLEKERAERQQSDAQKMRSEAAEMRKQLQGDPLYKPTTPEEARKRALHSQWIRESYDQFGKRKPGFMDESVWLKELEVREQLNKE